MPDEKPENSSRLICHICKALHFKVNRSVSQTALRCFLNMQMHGNQSGDQACAYPVTARDIGRVLLRRLEPGDYRLNYLQTLSEIKSRGYLASEHIECDKIGL